MLFFTWHKKSQTILALVCWFHYFSLLWCFQLHFSYPCIATIFLHSKKTSVPNGYNISERWWIFIILKSHCGMSISWVPCISESCIEIKIKLNFHFHTSLKRFYEGLKGLHEIFWGTTKKCENKNLTYFFTLCPGLGREGLIWSDWIQFFLIKLSK